MGRFPFWFPIKPTTHLRKANLLTFCALSFGPCLVMDPNLTFYLWVLWATETRRAHPQNTTSTCFRSFLAAPRSTSMAKLGTTEREATLVDPEGLLIRRGMLLWFCTLLCQCHNIYIYIYIHTYIHTCVYLISPPPSPPPVSSRGTCFFSAWPRQVHLLCSAAHAHAHGADASADCGGAADSSRICSSGNPSNWRFGIWLWVKIKPPGIGPLVFSPWFHLPGF